MYYRISHGCTKTDTKYSIEKQYHHIEPTKLEAMVSSNNRSRHQTRTYVHSLYRADAFTELTHGKIHHCRTNAHVVLRQLVFVQTYKVWCVIITYLAYVSIYMSVSVTIFSAHCGTLVRKEAHG